MLLRNPFGFLSHWSQNYKPTGELPFLQTPALGPVVLIFLRTIKNISPRESWGEGEVLACMYVFVPVFYYILPRYMTLAIFIAGWKLGPQLQADTDTAFHVDLDVAARLCVRVRACARARFRATLRALWEHRYHC